MKEILLDSFDEEIPDLLRLCYSTGSPIIVRNAIKPGFDESNWLDKLTCIPFLRNDNRQFDATTKEFFTATWWQITNVSSKSKAYAHSTGPQPLHSDNAWFSDPAEINIFIMKQQAAKGGEQIIYPLKKLLRDLESEDPQLYCLLTTIPVVIKKGNTSHSNYTTIIKFDGNVPKIFWNYYRVQRTTGQIESMIDRFYDFLAKKVSTCSDSLEYVHLESGDALIMNDITNLHGRTSFAASRDNERLLLQSMWKFNE
jgi:hypothetical protein